MIAAMDLVFGAFGLSAPSVALLWWWRDTDYARRKNRLTVHKATIIRYCAKKEKNG